jgi:hypothetical protein
MDNRYNGFVSVNEMMSSFKLTRTTLERILPGENMTVVTGIQKRAESDFKN